MKLSSAHVELETSGVGEQVQFTLVANAKAFHILSNGIYANKPLAVVREITCNALDAHTMANKADVPVEVHLPTMLEPWFSVTDHGIGLSDADVKSLYSTYFKSTKSTSDDMIGAFGLGSKSPFSYTTTFTVVSTYNGVKSTYAMAIGAEGFPSVIPMGSEETDEGNGFKVEVPVNHGDSSVFVDAATRTYEYFTVCPITNFPLKFREKEVVLEGDGWQVFRNVDHSYYDRQNRETVAIMGNVAYPIKFTIKQLQQYSEVFYRLGATLTFNIGDLDVAVSREELSYDERTIKNITTKLEVILSQIADNFLKTLEKCPTLWEARKYAYTTVVESELNVISSILKRSKKSITWKGNVIDRSRQWVIPSKFGDKTIRVANPVTGILDENPNYLVVKNPAASYNSHEIEYSTHTFFVHDCYDALGRTRHWMETQISSPARPCLVQSPSKNQAAIDSFFAEMGNPENIVKASTLAKRPVRPRPTVAMNTFKVFCVEQYISSYNRSYRANDWDNEKIDVANETEIVYLPMIEYQPMNKNGQSIDLKKFKTMIVSLAALHNKPSLRVVGLGLADMKKYGAMLIAPKWILFEDYVEREIKKFETNTMFSKSLEHSQTNEELNVLFGGDRNDLATLTKEILTDFNMPTDLTSFFNIVQTCAHKRGNQHADNPDWIKSKCLMTLCQLYNNPVPKTTASANATELWNKLIITYPILKLVVSNRSNIDRMKTKLILDYIRKDVKLQLTEREDDCIIY